MDSPLIDRTSFDFDELQLEPFKNTAQVQGFFSGDQDLDDFLNTYEVAEYQRQRLGATTLVYIEGELVAYFTVAPSSLKVEYLRTQKAMNKKHEWLINPIPAYLIGRLAVRDDLQGKGLGRLLVEYMIADALEKDDFPCRLVVLNATANSIQFYQRIGFQLSSHHSNKNRNQKVMFYDLEPIR